MIKKMNDKKWYFCPQGHKTSQVIEDESTMNHVPIYCKHCRKVYFPYIFQGKEIIKEAIT